MHQHNLHYYDPITPLPQAVAINTDICIYGATSGGVIAAVTARRLGLRVALVEFGEHLGGMTSSGLGATDIGT